MIVVVDVKKIQVGNPTFLLIRMLVVVVPCNQKELRGDLQDIVFREKIEKTFVKEQKECIYFINCLLYTSDAADE